MINKQQLVSFIEVFIEDKLRLLKSDIATIQASANEESKSSAGDKYETGRAMAQNEIQKLLMQTGSFETMQLKTKQINWYQGNNEVSVGSLVMGVEQTFLIGLGLGEIEFENRKIMAISPITPIGKLLMNKKVGDKISFQNKPFEILKVV